MLAHRVDNRRRALVGVIAYTAGRILAYVCLALILLAGFASMPVLSTFLRTEIVPLVGPFLILAGMVVLGWLPLPLDLRAGNAFLTGKLANWGLLGELGLGTLFALSFCPVSAALFFGSLLPLALPSPFPPLTVAVYGIGTALPVAIIAFLLVVSSRLATAAVGRIQRLQKWATLGTGAVLSLVGVYLTVTQTIIPALAG